MSCIYESLAVNSCSAVIHRSSENSETTFTTFTLLNNKTAGTEELRKGRVPLRSVPLRDAATLLLGWKGKRIRGRIEQYAWVAETAGSGF